MRIIPLLILLLLLAEAAPAQFIPWSAERPLAWPDFQCKKRPRRKRWAASTASTIDYKINYCTADSANVTITALFIPSKSWKRNNRLKPYLLNHEQMHFNITELYARKLRSRLYKCHQSHQSFRHKEGWMHLLYVSNHRQWRHCERRYDRQTNHSRRRANQEEWNQKILSDLDELKAFAQ